MTWLTPRVPSFIAYNNAKIENVTGDGTVFPLVLGQVFENIGSHYNTGTGVFAVPITGPYTFKIVTVFMDMGGTDVDIRVVRTGTAATWYLRHLNPDKVMAGTDLTLNGSIDLVLDSGDTIAFHVQVAGTTKTVDVEVGTIFSGRLVA